MVCEHLLPVCRFPFHFVNDFFCCAKASKFDYVSFVIFIFISIALEDWPKKTLLPFMSEDAFAYVVF